MTELQVRQATLDDTQAISALFRSQIQVWQRFDAEGRVQDVEYHQLTIYERWLHGGPWMSVETAAIQLCQLLIGAGIPLVATLGDEVVGYAEAYHGHEPPPFGDHLHVAYLIVAPDFVGRGAEDALMGALRERAKTLKAKTLTVSRVGDATATVQLQDHFDFEPLCRVQRMSLPARTGQIFYRATEHTNADAAQIRGWGMPVGRMTSARQEWEHLWPPTWETIPELRNQRTHRLHVSAAGQEAFVCFRQQLYDPRSVDIYCWSPKPLTNQLVSALRDWAHREGYRNLYWVVADDTVKTLGPEAELSGYSVEICAVTPREPA
ncbi:MAG: GNAT family N-acetyltransferase [Chloroflexota bacterium]|nr:MAG: hypothetical protein DIU68_16480 [Chloroflexota bacterium]